MFCVLKKKFPLKRCVEQLFKKSSISSLSYEFDLNGFVILRNVLSEFDLKNMNDGIDAMRSKHAISRDSKSLKNAKEGSYFDEKGSRVDLGGFLRWSKVNGGDSFRSLLVSERISNALNVVVGERHRLDHEPLILIQNKNSEGFKLHGGPMLENGILNPELQYRATSSGNIYNTLVACFVALTETSGKRDGGLSLLRGSHKSSFATPADYIDGNDEEKRSFLDEHLYTPALNPGDVVIFSEATVHGARPWLADHERRVVLLRFSPRNFAYGRSYFHRPNRSEEEELMT